MLESDIRRRIYSFCAYQERTINEVRKKLLSFDLPQARIEDLVEELTEENFVNEERYVDSFVHGKLRNKRWGRLKIKSALRTKGLPSILVTSGLQTIEEAEYLRILADLIAAKSKSLRDGNALVRKHKIARFAIGKGFEPSLVWDKINQANW